MIDHKNDIPCNRRAVGMIGGVIILFILAIIALFPVQVDGLVDERYTETELQHKCILVETINCNMKLSNGKTNSYSFNKLGDNLRVITDISSTEDLRLKIESINKVEINQLKKIILFNTTMTGPSLVIRLENPWEFFGEEAQVKGSIQIYHEYDEWVEVEKVRQVLGKVWRLWWMV